MFFVFLKILFLFSSDRNEIFFSQSESQNIFFFKTKQKQNIFFLNSIYTRNVFFQIYMFVYFLNPIYKGIIYMV